MNDLSIDLFLSLVCDTMSAHCAALFMPTGNSFALVSAATSGNPNPIAASLEPGKGIVGWILRNQRPLIVNTLDTANRSYLGYYDMDAERRITAFLGVPIQNGGVLCVDAIGGQRSFTTTDQRTLSQAAAVITAQLKESEISKSQGRSNEYLEALASLQSLALEHTGWRHYLQSFLTILHETTAYDYVALAMLPEDSNTYIVEGETEELIIPKSKSLNLAIGSGLAGYVLNEGLPVFVEGTEGTPTSPLFGKIAGIPQFQGVICLPVRHSGTVCGVLIFASKKRCTISPAMKTLTTAAAAIIGSHLEILFLRHRVQAFLAQQTAGKKSPEPSKEATEDEAQNSSEQNS